MNTPICDFVKKYISENKIRLHMPGHKGKPYLGIEPFDITEIKGADALLEAEGIIKESEKNASRLFGSEATYYSTEGSSLCIRTMLSLVVKYALSQNKPPRVIVGRNAHKTFVSACALLDFSFSYIPEIQRGSYLSCSIDYSLLDVMIKEESPTAIYVTSPDYLGLQADVKRLSQICKKHGVLLLVDNAHGAYLNFLEDPIHPIKLGADLCCDSAHKTLPVLTGGAYLHVSKDAPDFFTQNVKSSMSIFASTSPSYLILQSLDFVNGLLSSDYKKKLSDTVKKLEIIKADLRNNGFEDLSTEPLKITLRTKPYGYTGLDFANELRSRNIECEFADPDFVVLMLTPDNTDTDIISSTLLSIPRKTPIDYTAPKLIHGERVMSVKEAVFAKSERIPVSQSCGRILSSLNVGCPPAVPIVVCGERINSSSVKLFDYYGIDFCDVVV